MSQKKNVKGSRTKIRVYDEASSSSIDQTTVYANQEHARPRAKVDQSNIILSQSASDTSTSDSKQSLSSSITRFRSDFDDLKCKMKIFGESLNLCRCIAHDFKIKLNNMEKRLNKLEKRQGVSRITSNYSAIIQKNRTLSHKTLEDAKRLQMCKTEKEKCEVAARICRNYLSGAWKTVDPHVLLFEKISGGLSNFLYYVALPDYIMLGTTPRDSAVCMEPEDSCSALGRTEQEPEDSCSAFGRTERSYSFSVIEEPRNVLLRIYGQVYGERAMNAIVTESVIFTLLSERKLGPKLHGVFSGGRIEEYIPARCLKTKELGEPALSLKIAEKMAAIHTMDVPLAKEPTWLWKNLSKWMKTVKEERLIGSYEPKSNEEKRIIEEIKRIDFADEIEWLKKYLDTFASPVVFCHNDLQEGNILVIVDTPVLVHPLPVGEQEVHLSVEAEECAVSESLLSTSDLGEPRLILIDFEYCAYNYRGFDIANHFQEWIIDYTNQSYPFYFIMEEYTPTTAQKDMFIKSYLTHYTGNISEDQNPLLPMTSAINRIRNEADAFALASHLFWSLWSFVNATKSQIPFGYWEYGFTRLEYYKKLKVEELKKIATPRPKNSEIEMERQASKRQ